MLATRDLANPILWAVIVGWILTVVLHEFAHGLVAFLGGDYTIRERGGLTLNPLQYIHPVISILIPAAMVLMGGIPLPGGVTYIRTDLLRNRCWVSAVALAGPCMNFLIFLALALPFHPAIGWIKLDPNPLMWNNLQLFIGALAFLQLYGALLNLLPFPGVDGFNAIAPFLPADLQQKLKNSQISMFGIFALYLFMSSHAAQDFLASTMFRVMTSLRFDGESQEFFRMSFNQVLFGSAN